MKKELTSYYYLTALGESDGLSGSKIDSLLYDLGEEGIESVEVLLSPDLLFLNTMCNKMSELDRSKFINKLKAKRRADMVALSEWFVSNEEEGYSDKILIVLGNYGDYVKTRLLTATLVELGAAPKNTKSLADQLVNSGLVELGENKDEGEGFRLTKEGWIKRKLLLHRAEKSREEELGSRGSSVSESKHT